MTTSTRPPARHRQPPAPRPPGPSSLVALAVVLAVSAAGQAWFLGPNAVTSAFSATASLALAAAVVMAARGDG